ncbi:ABC transporter substrate-binding protein [Natrinema hispanicum]|uniref:Amino acid/amide ABC transporter substrate-binding protein, HAAT family n=1 Tax=Natrinema hispanicum TaxID=392421 RepID=A0A1I0IEV1_9EURY|nr:ABC transporter substrate-binding protein [Natrinema hispanicum]SET94535.1 amino acid/amide ABC transporter substrate-binding protein, HAAT family [Natrinema hispanicum]
MRGATNGDNDSIVFGSSRRTFLSAAGAAGTVALAGCAGGSGNETVTIASLNPMSGAYSSLGPAQRNGVELAVQQINDSDEFDYEIDAVYDDTETEAGAASQAAQEVVQQEQADFVFGAISSSVALGLNEFASDAEFVYFPGAAAVPVTGEACNEWVFRFETSTAQIAEAISAYTVNEIGSNVWFHIADYAYGDSVYNRTRERMQDANSNFTEVGKTESSLGSSNFGSYISQISSSDADAVILGMTGGDLVNFVNQAANQGLAQEKALVGPTMAFKSARSGAGSNAVGTYGGVRYDPSVDLGDNQQFVEAYQNEYDGVPGNFERVGYESIRLMVRGMQEAGSTDPTDVRDALEGGTFTTVLGDITLRESDHQATNPTWIGELVEGDGDMANVDLLSKVEGENTLPPGSELGCELN